jgi:hypothetical protein
MKEKKKHKKDKWFFLMQFWGLGPGPHTLGKHFPTELYTSQ